ncbi:hypothetical protein QFC22_001241 [Naganishia vaughanmartiniae]|uniref:Uncharacterized protein n=1 Tax=Naganishia vaughanmartiniae TaxID=1424756 RepID=A0ACC2XGK1_9TREE|nr:hypothetical protein QFC22_001241 [Naganishia vaughanmartiniae]
MSISPFSDFTSATLASSTASFSSSSSRSPDLFSAGSSTSTLTSTGAFTATPSVYINTSYVYSPSSYQSDWTTDYPIRSTGTAASLTASPITYPESSETSSTRHRVSSTRSSPASSSTAKVIVPSAGQVLQQGENGLILNLTLAGDDVGQAVYSVPIVFGHVSESQLYERAVQEVEERQEMDRRDKALRKRGKRRPNDDGAGDEGRRSTGDGSSRSFNRRAPGSYQSMQLQVDLGSSDMVSINLKVGLAHELRSTLLPDDRNSMDASAYVNLTYQSGHAAGEVYWDEIQMGVTVSQIESAVNGTGGGGSNGFDVGYQAFVAANDVGNEDLSGGQFSGILGLALPANSVILNQLGGSTSGNPDGAPFLDNLFGSGENAPQGRYFSLSLERIGDTRTKSTLGIGMFDKTLCPDPCIPNYSSVVTSSQGPLYWRIPLQGITTYTWPSGQAPASINATTAVIKLPSSTTTGQSYPVAVLDSGGYQVLLGDRTLVDSIYAVFGGSRSSDGNYYLRCDVPLALSFTFGGKQYPVHPLDMSDYSSTDPSQKTCLGLIQYAPGLTAGDVILGVSFLKNVYSIYTYPSSYTSTSSWLPMVGMLSLTNMTAAGQEFYDVRVQHSTYPGQVTTTGSTPSRTADAAASQAGHQVLSGGIIALAVVLGFVGIAAGLFCAWFFWLRKKYGSKGVPVFAGRRGRKGASGSISGTEGSMGGTDRLELTAGGAGVGRRSKKYRDMQRQKSMIDGYLDFDTDLWSDDKDSRTDADTATSRSMDGVAGNPVLAEEVPRGRRASSKAWESSYPPAGWITHQRTPSSPRRQEQSPPTLSSPLAAADTDAPDGDTSHPRSSQRFADADEGPYPTFSSMSRQAIMSPTQEPLMIPSGPPQTPAARPDDGAHYFDSPITSPPPPTLYSRGSILRIHDPSSNP